MQNSMTNYQQRQINKNYLNWFIFFTTFQNFPFLLCVLLICLVLDALCALLSFFNLESTCFTFLLSLPPVVLNLFDTMYFFLSFKARFSLS